MNENVDSRRVRNLINFVKDMDTNGNSEDNEKVKAAKTELLELLLELLERFEKIKNTNDKLVDVFLQTEKEIYDKFSSITLKEQNHAYYNILIFGALSVLLTGLSLFIPNIHLAWRAVFAFPAGMCASLVLIWLGIYNSGGKTKFLTNLKTLKEENEKRK